MNKSTETSTLNTTHYGERSLPQRIIQGLIAAGLDLQRLKPADLRRIDQLHMGGHQATLELADKVGVTGQMQVLDVGSGLGGTSRLLADMYGCRVTGVDITRTFCESAQQLTRLVGMADQVVTLQANALQVPISGNHFDLIWCQHTQMNIHDKNGLIREFSRLLKSGGKLALHEVFSGNGSDPAYPVPWASRAEESHLIQCDRLLQQLTEHGFSLIHHNEVTRQAEQWWDKLAAKRDRQPNNPLGPKLIFGEQSRQYGPNVVDNLRRGAIEVHELILEYRGKA